MITSNKFPSHLFNGFLCTLALFFPNQTICVEEIGGRKQLAAWVMEKWLCWHCQHLPLLFPSDWDFPETEHPHTAEAQLLYPGSLYSNLKRIMTLPRRLQIKWHKPWWCCSSLIYPPIQDLEWFFSLQAVSYFTGTYMCTTEHKQACNHWLSHLEIPLVLLHQLGF